MSQLPRLHWVKPMRAPTVGPPIVFAHGYGQTCGSFWALARAMSSLGRGPMFPYDYSSLDDIEASADGLGRFIDTVQQSTGAPRVDLIGYSLGGLVIAEHLRRAGSERNVRRCITLASPHGGIRWRGPLPGRAAQHLRRDSAYLRDLARARLPIPVLNVSSENDDVVYPARALWAEGGRDLSISGVGHLALLFSEQMFQAVAAFLGEEDAVRSPSLAGIRVRSLAEFNPRSTPADGAEDPLADLAATG